MTYSNQEVPTWETFQETNMYDLNLPEALGDNEQYFVDNLDIKLEDSYSPIMPYQHQPPNQSMLASPGMNMPILCRSYNPYSPASVVQSLASPSSSFVHSPGESSTYSASPIHSPQQQMPAEDYMRYSMRQAFQPRHPLPPPVEYGFYYNEYGLKRRKRDDELSPEEYEKRRVRRERNKQAALRCRTRRRERIDALEQETSQIEEDNEKVETEINSLKKQIEELHTLLKEHSCNKHGQSSTSQTMKST